MNRRTVADERRIESTHSILADRERRAIVRALKTNEGSLTVAALTDRLTGRRSKQVIRVRLHHQHLPKMERAGIVDYDQGSGRVSLTPLGRRVGEIAERTDELLDGDTPSVG
jgi:predicted transcriptional regulator